VRLLGVSPHDFSGSSAAAKRWRLLFQALAHAGCETELISVSTADSGGLVDDGRLGFLDHHTRIEIPAGTSTVARYRLLRRKFYVACQERFAAGRPMAVLVYNQTAFAYSPLLSLARRHGILRLGEFNEYHPPWVFRGGLASPFYWDQNMFRLLVSRNLDGLLGISSFWSTWCPARPPVLVMPPLVDPARALPFAHETRRNGFTLGYLGQCGSRDLPGTMIDAVALARERGVPARLLMFGRSTTTTRQLAARHPEFVEDRGFIDEADLLARLQRECDAFLLLRRGDRESLACSPTRLGDYLNAGRPLIASDVGVIHDHFPHGTHCLRVPSDPRAEIVAEAIATLCRDSSLAASLAARAQERAKEALSHHIHARHLMDFVSRLESSARVAAGRAA
jgi:glycosyltransferase involved in cell wall biosynthesis